MPDTISTSERIRRRIAAYDWNDVEESLASCGYARLPGLLANDECGELARIFERDELFRSTVEMRAHAYGDGCYRYFGYPLPPLIAALRTRLYPRLRAIGNRWHEQLGIEARYPAGLGRFLETCHAAGQTRPTPLILRYGSDGYNRMHQDVYGDVAFPLQVACLLSRRGEDFTGGEFLISETRPRMQVRTEAVSLEQGEGIAFANAIRPVASTRGFARAQMRHGASRIGTGERLTLGIIFHDAS